MQADKVTNLLLALKDKVPDDRLRHLERFFCNAKDDAYEEILSTRLKSPKLTIVFACFLGFLGADRFYVKDVITGVQKLLFSWLTLGVWPLVDIFITYRLCKEENFITLRDKLEELERSV